MDKFIGCILLVVISWLTGVTMAADHINHDIITECEKTLPRDKHCIVIAVPEKESE